MLIEPFTTVVDCPEIWRLIFSDTAHAFLLGTAELLILNGHRKTDRVLICLAEGLVKDASVYDYIAMLLHKHSNLLISASKCDVITKDYFSTHHNGNSELEKQVCWWATVNSRVKWSTPFPFFLILTYILFCSIKHTKMTLLIMVMWIGGRQLSQDSLKCFSYVRF